MELGINPGYVRKQRGNPQGRSFAEALRLCRDAGFIQLDYLSELGDDWERVRVLMDEVWGTGATWVNDAMRAEQDSNPALLRPVLVEETEGAKRVVSYAALRLTPGVDFAGLWGGTTHPKWRGRGLYRALTAYRAKLALAAGHPFVRVDTAPDSRPILTRLGLHQVTTTTPCVFDPRGSSRSG